MNDSNLVGRIDHSDHDHPNTSHALRMCRQRIVAEARGEKGKARKARKVRIESPVEREARASVALDHGDGGTYSVEGGHDAAKVDTNVFLSPKPVMFPLHLLSELEDVTRQVEDNLGAMGNLRSAVIRMDVAEGGEVTLVNDGTGWAVQIG